MPARNNRTAIMSKRNMNKYVNSSYSHLNPSQEGISGEVSSFITRPHTSLQPKKFDGDQLAHKNLPRNNSNFSQKKKEDYPSESYYPQRSSSLRSSKKFATKKGIFRNSPKDEVLYESNTSELIIRPTNSLNRSLAALPSGLSGWRDGKSINNLRKSVPEKEPDVQINFKFLWKLPEGLFKPKSNLQNQLRRQKCLRTSKNIVKGLSKPGISVPKVTYASKKGCKIHGVGISLSPALYG